MQLPYTKSAGNEALKHLDVESFLCGNVCCDHLLFDLKKLTRCLSVFKFNHGLGFREMSLASVHILYMCVATFPVVFPAATGSVCQFRAYRHSLKPNAPLSFNNVLKSWL